MCRSCKQLCGRTQGRDVAKPTSESNSHKPNFHQPNRSRRRKTEMNAGVGKKDNKCCRVTRASRTEVVVDPSSQRMTHVVSRIHENSKPLDGHLGYLQSISQILGISSKAVQRSCHQAHAHGDDQGWPHHLRFFCDAGWWGQANFSTIICSFCSSNLCSSKSIM